MSGFSLRRSRSSSRFPGRPRMLPQPLSTAGSTRWPREWSSDGRPGHRTPRSGGAHSRIFHSFVTQPETGCRSRSIASSRCSTSSPPQAIRRDELRRGSVWYPHRKSSSTCASHADQSMVRSRRSCRSGSALTPLPSIGPTCSLEEGAFGAHVWASIGFDPITLAQNEGTNDLGRALLEGVRAEERRAGSVDLRAGVDEFLPAGAAVAMPSVLLFGRGTMSRSERYAPARGFGLEPVENHSMLCERLSAMRPADREPFLKELSKAVLDDGRPSPARLVFDDEDGGLAISFAERQHSLALLDRSERALLTLHAAIMLHGTSTTIVLIDGIDCHCLPEDLGYLNNSLAEILVRDRGSTVIFASATQPAVDSLYRIASPIM